MHVTGKGYDTGNGIKGVGKGNIDDKNPPSTRRTKRK